MDDNLTARVGMALDRIRMTQQNKGDDSVALEDTDNDLVSTPLRVHFCVAAPIRRPDVEGRIVKEMAVPPYIHMAE